MRRVILASSSPRRRDLLDLAGLAFSVAPAEIDESPRPGESPEELVCRLADGKARAVAGQLDDKDAILIAADTVVVLDKQILGKPADSEAASTMLRQLSGRSHRVVTGFAVHGPQSSRTGWVSTRVLFRQLSDGVIARYVATGEPLDKAGSYGIQSGGAVLVLAIEGSYTNVVGLPLVETLAALAEVGGPEL